jgi:hypothetical protein
MKGLFKVMTKDKLKNLLPLAKLCLEERGLSGVSTSEYCIELAEKLYELQTGGVYVDNVDDPKHLIGITHFPDFWTSQLVCSVSVIYSHPDHRKVDYLNEMLEVISNYAIMNSCNKIVFSTDNRRLGSILERKGYTYHETVYKKEVNSGIR